MDAKTLIIDQITKDILKGFVCDLARNQDVVISAVRTWAEDLYAHIENIQKIEALASKKPPQTVN